MARFTGLGPEPIEHDADCILVDDTDGGVNDNASTDFEDRVTLRPNDKAVSQARQENQNSSGSSDVSETEGSVQWQVDDRCSESMDSGIIPEEESPEPQAQAGSIAEVGSQLVPLFEFETAGSHHIDPIMELVMLADLLETINNSLSAELEQIEERERLAEAEMDKYEAS